MISQEIIDYTIDNQMNGTGMITFARQDGQYEHVLQRIEIYPGGKVTKTYASIVSKSLIPPDSKEFPKGSPIVFEQRSIMQYASCSNCSGRIENTPSGSVCTRRQEQVISIVLKVSVNNNQGMLSSIGCNSCNDGYD